MTQGCSRAARGGLGGRHPWDGPLGLLLRTRRTGWALLTGLLLAVGLLVTERDVPVPLFGTTTTTVFVWPVLATVPTAVVLSPAMQEWEARSARPVPLLHAAVVSTVVATSVGAVVLLRPPRWASALAVFAVLQALTVLATRLLGDWAWMPTVAVGSLMLFNTPVVTEGLVRYADRFWVPLTVAAGVVVVACLAAPPPNGSGRRRSRRRERGRRAQ